MKFGKNVIRSVLARIALLVARRRQRLDQLSMLGRPTFVSRSAEFSFHGRVSIGRYCRIGPYCHLDGEGGLAIADGTILAPRVAILTGSHNYEQANFLPYDEADSLGAVEVGAGVWIGFGALIMPGVTVGDGAVIGAGSVVTKSVGIGEIVVGNPAKVVSRRQIDNQTIKALVENRKFFIRAIYNHEVSRNGRKRNSLENIV